MVFCSSDLTYGDTDLFLELRYSEIPLDRLINASMSNSSPLLLDFIPTRSKISTKSLRIFLDSSFMPSPEQNDDKLFNSVFLLEMYIACITF